MCAGLDRVASYTVRGNHAAERALFRRRWPTAQVSRADELDDTARPEALPQAGVRCGA